MIDWNKLSDSELEEIHSLLEDLGNIIYFDAVGLSEKVNAIIQKNIISCLSIEKVQYKRAKNG